MLKLKEKFDIKLGMCKVWLFKDIKCIKVHTVRPYTEKKLLKFVFLKSPETKVKKVLFCNLLAWQFAVSLKVPFYINSNCKEKKYFLKN